MVTKKQKRAAAMEKREAFLEEVRLSGLKAQKESREAEAEIPAHILENSRKVKERNKSILANKMHAAKVARNKNTYIDEDERELRYASDFAKQYAINNSVTDKENI